MLTSETKRRIDACRDVLVGKLPLPTDQVELITLALIYKFMDDLDEQSVQMGGKRSFFTGELEPYRWRNLLPQTISAEQRVALFSGGLEAMSDATRAVHLPLLFRDIFRNAFLKFRDGRILTLFLTEINGFTYSHSEELGNAFEYLLQCMGIQGENGQFRTPRHIIDFIVACLDPKPSDTILDPACGTGGFLVSAYKHILAKHTSAGASMTGDLLTHAERQLVYGNLIGYDITDLMVKLSKVNLFLHGFPSPAIHDYDTLSNDARWNEKADLILANPPFMTPRGGVTPHTKFRIHAKKAEVLFTDYIAEHLTSDGRGGIIVPNGIVATAQTAYVKLRKFLVEDSLVAVVSLPAGVFKPYSGVKTSILFLDKQFARQKSEILFLKVAADGFDLGDKRNQIEANDLPESERLIKAWFKGSLDGEFETPLVWKQVQKRDLLEDENHSLSVERFLREVARDFETPRVCLGDIATFDYGHTAIAGKTGDARYIRITDIDEYGRLRPNEAKFIALDDEAKTCIAHKGDIFVARIGATAGKTLLFMSSEPAVFASYLIRVRFDPDKMMPEFYWSLARSKQYWEQREQLISGGGQPQLNANALKLIEVPLPPLEEQKRIAAELEGFQKVIDGARQIVDAHKPAFDIDPNWPLAPLRSLCESITDGDHQPPPKSSNGVPFVTISNITAHQRLDFSNTFFVSVDYYERLSSNRQPRKGDILYTVTGSYGIPVMIDFDERFCFQRHIGLIRPLPSTNSAFLYWMLRSTFVAAQAEKTAVGAAQLTVSLNSLRNFKIPLPPVEEQQRISAQLDAEAAQIEIVRGLIPAFEIKIQRVLDRVWGSGTTE